MFEASESRKRLSHLSQLCMKPRFALSSAVHGVGRIGGIHLNTFLIAPRYSIHAPLFLRHIDVTMHGLTIEVPVQNLIEAIVNVGDEYVLPWLWPKQLVPASSKDLSMMFGCTIPFVCWSVTKHNKGWSTASPQRASQGFVRQRTGYKNASCALSEPLICLYKLHAM